MFKTHTDGFAQTKSFEVFNVGIQQFSDFRIIFDTPSCYYELDRSCYELGDYVLVSGVIFRGEFLNYVICDVVGSLDYCLESALRKSRIYDHYHYEIWQLCDDGDLWQGWELSCLSVDHDETKIVSYADREQGAWAYGLLRATWHSGGLHGDCYALIFEDGAVFARGDWQGYALDGVDDAVDCYCGGGWDCLGFVDWHSCFVDSRTSLYVWESQVIDWLRLYGLEITWHDAKLRDEREFRIESTGELVA